MKLAQATQTPDGQLNAAALNAVIGYQLAQAAVSTAAVFSREVGTPHELRPVEYTVLQLICENPGSSPVQLAKALAVTKPNITMWVDRLVARSLVRRKPSTSDKRAQELHATAAGKHLAARATASLLQGEAQALALLSAAERALLAELLHKVACSVPRRASRASGDLLHRPGRGQHHGGHGHQPGGKGPRGGVNPQAT